ncbi:MAG: alpha-glucan family phosphorylase [Conexivisphaerales archaeon]|jgi:starch phosphorylase
MTLAYFVMEIGLESDIPTYSGGLGILAGDTAYAFADMGIPAVFLTLLYKAGYTKQKLSPSGQQQDLECRWLYKERLTPLRPVVRLEVEDSVMSLKLWQYTVKGRVDVPVIFLDTDVLENPPSFRSATDRLYLSEGRERLIQELILGVGGYRALKALDISADLYQMNESHAALLTVELLKEYRSLAEVRRHCVFTTHTPVAGGHDSFPLQMVRDVLKKYYWMDWGSEAGGDAISLSHLAAKYSCLTNAVSLRHRFTSGRILHSDDIEHVTNGVYHRRWVQEEIKGVFDKYIPSWEAEPHLLVHAYEIPPDELAMAHRSAKAKLVSLVDAQSTADFSEEPLTIGLAKRITAYKRNGMVLGDPRRLAKIADEHGRIQLVFAGKAHPKDDAGKESLVRMYEQANQVMMKTDKVKVAFIEDYSIEIAKVMVSGCDVWLNNPRRPLEASGTSGMKAALNGVLNLSVWDGWWLEGGVEGVNGWGIGRRPAWDALTESDDSEDMEALYTKLADQVLPMYYKGHSRWLEMAKASIATIGPRFNTYRMVREYMAKWYARSNSQT